MRTIFQRAAISIGLAAAMLLPQPVSPAAERRTRAKPQKPQRVHKAPISELILRIQTEEARLDTARKLSLLAVTPDEKQLAQRALRLADHQLDLAFLVALRRAADNSEPVTPELRELESTVQALQRNVDEQQPVVDQLKKQVDKARGRRKENLQEQLEIESAKLELANDELAAAREDLIAAGGDLKSQIERLQAEHKASEGATPSGTPTGASSPSAIAAAESSDTLLAHLKLWFDLHTLRAQLQAAQSDAAAAVDLLQQRLDALEKEPVSAKPAADSNAKAAATKPQAKPAKRDAEEQSATLEMLRQQSRQQKIVAGTKLRIHDMTDLAATYSKWDALEATKQSEVTRSIAFSLLWILLIVLAGVAINLALVRVFQRMTHDRRRMHTLRTLSRFAVQACCLGLILLVVLGPPTQLATLIAFAGAGLTVALKDFIVSFIGWFMLMGRNGVHAGDWVEINGVSGEVLEVTLFHTVLLETGNWNDPGHPTGRKVNFTNSYAIEGHYFNFTTSGQWLWDELEFLVPSADDPHAIAEAILQMVTEETQSNAKIAEQEWSRLSTVSGEPAAHVTAAPVLNIRPSGAGINGRIRYITRANERFQTRTHLYSRVVELLHGRGTASVVAPKAPTEPATANS